MESSPTNLLTRWWLVEPNPFIKIWQPSNWIISPENWGWKLQKYCQKPQPLNKPNNQGPGVHFLFIAPTHLGHLDQKPKSLNWWDQGTELKATNELLARAAQAPSQRHCEPILPASVMVGLMVGVWFVSGVWWFEENIRSWVGGNSLKFSLVVSCDWGNYLGCVSFFSEKKGEKDNVQRQKKKHEFQCSE